MMSTSLLHFGELFAPVFVSLKANLIGITAFLAAFQAVSGQFRLF